MQTEPEKKWSKNDAFKIPGWRIPSWRTSFACQQGVEKNILFKTWGGIGDQICAEPTLRYALEHFKDCKVTLASSIPEVFGHLKFHDVYDLTKESPILDDYLWFDTNSEADQFNLVYQFISHNVIHCVDFPTLCALRCTLPVAEKSIVLEPPRPPAGSELYEIANQCGRYVIVHAGKHWQSKTFPKKWWDEALFSIVGQGFTPVLIGRENGPGQGTVDVDTAGCVDLRNKTTLNETIWLLKNSAVVICNDSSPLHMAVAGDAWIGFFATAKHYDYLYHWRRGQWAWRMKNLSLGGYWDLQHYCPNQIEEKTIDKVDPKILESWLPDPKTVGAFCKEKMIEYIRSL